MEEKYLIWHVQGGLGKNIAATALCKDIKEKYSDRKFILVCNYPKVFFNNSYIDKVYDLNSLSFFYTNYIKDKDTIIFKHDPCNTTGHIKGEEHIIKSWCEILNIPYVNQLPSIHLNYAQKLSLNKWARPKPILLLQTTGGPGFLQLSNALPPYSWVRDIPYELSQKIITKYSLKYHIVHITRPGGYPLSNVERIENKLDFLDLISLITISQKRIFIDSALQHLSSSLKVPSNVIWIGTKPEVYGYSIHNNIKATLPKSNLNNLYSYELEYELANNEYECPFFEVNEIFDINQVLKDLDYPNKNNILHQN